MYLARSGNRGVPRDCSHHEIPKNGYHQTASDVFRLDSKEIDTTSFQKMVTKWIVRITNFQKMVTTRLLQTSSDSIVKK